MKIDTGKPLVASAAAGVLADVWFLASVETSVNKHVGALGESLTALRAGMQNSGLPNAGWLVTMIVHCGER